MLAIQLPRYTGKSRKRLLSVLRAVRAVSDTTPGEPLYNTMASQQFLPANYGHLRAECRCLDDFRQL